MNFPIDADPRPLQVLEHKRKILAMRLEAVCHTKLEATRQEAEMNVEITALDNQISALLAGGGAAA